MSKNYVRADSQVYNSNETNGNVRKLADCINTDNEIKVSLTSDTPATHGLATAANQDLMIDLLEGQTPALNRTKAIPVQIMVGDAGSNYDALRANGQDLLVMIDDMNPDVAANSGLARSDKQDTQTNKLTEIDNAIDAMSEKITTGSDDSITGDLQQNLVYGRCDTNGDLKAVRVNLNGTLITAPTDAAIVTTDGTTSEQRVMLLAHTGGNLRTLACSDGGQLQIERDYSWDNTNQIFNAVACADGATITSTTFDLGSSVSHEIGLVEFFLDNSASVALEVQGLTSHDGTNFYNSGGTNTVNSSKASFYFSQEEVGIGGGHRYMRLSVTNNNGLGTSTNISCQVGVYK